MLGTAASSSTTRLGMPGRIETVKSGAVIFFRSSSTITSLAISLRLAGTVLQALEPVLHFGNPAFEPGYQGFIGEGRTNDSREDLVQVGLALHRIGEGPLINLGVFRTDAVTDPAIGYGGEFEIHPASPTPG